MSVKAILVLCAQALFLQSAFSQCIGRAAIDAPGLVTPYGFPGTLAAPGFATAALTAPALAYDGLAYPGAGCSGLAPLAPAMEFTATTGGGLIVTSASAVPPTGISVISDNVYEGVLAAAGEVPFVGTTGMEGVLPTAGAGAINHNCGNGLTAMTSLAPAAVAPGIAIAPGFAPAAAIAPGLAPASIAPGLASAAFSGCGCGIVY